MVKIKSRQIFYILGTLLGLSYYGLAMLIAKNDTDFSDRWLSLSLWISAVFISLLIAIVKKLDKPHNFKKILGRDELVPLLIIILLALVTRFSFLKSYPFVAVMDEVRDGGLNAQQIISGEIKNIHGYGRYESHGLIIPTIVVPFYLALKNSVFSYRVPAALASILDILIIYFLARRLSNRRTAFFAALIIINLPLHLYYGRTEIVVIFSSLLTSLILLSLYLLNNRKTVENYSLLGLLLGFSSGFHASIRTVIFITLVITFALTLYSLLKESSRSRSITGLVSLIVFFFIGFGPRLMFTPLRVFLHTRTIPILKEAKAATPSFTIKIVTKNLQEIGRRYSDSLGAYTHKPVTLHYQDKEPILAPVLAILFIFGLFSAAFLTRESFGRCLVLYALLIPLTNSALTDCLNCDHRLASTLPISALVTALGITHLTTKIRKFLPQSTWFIRSLLIILGLYIVFQGYAFFSKELASKGKSWRDYLSMHTVYLLKSLPAPKRVCLTASAKNNEFFDLMHIKEQHEFFLPGAEIRRSVNETLPENEIYLSENCRSLQGPFTMYERCLERQNFLCPLDSNLNLKFYIENSLLPVKP